MKHAILGAGAVGGLVGTALASLGEDVTVIVRPEKLADYPAEIDAGTAIRNPDRFGKSCRQTNGVGRRTVDRDQDLSTASCSGSRAIGSIRRRSSSEWHRSRMRHCAPATETRR